MSDSESEVFQLDGDSGSEDYANSPKAKKAPVKKAAMPKAAKVGLDVLGQRRS